MRFGVAVIACAALLSACAPAPSPSPSPTAHHVWGGAQLQQADPKPEFTLTDQSGAAFDLDTRTAGSVTVLYFGYTHCPDACPATMATLALALRRVPADVRAKVAVVFVTTDPARDTPAALRTWLSAIDPTFIGLTGTHDQIVEAQVASHLGVALLETPGPDGGYTVDHSAVALVFGGDGLAHIGFPSGVTAASEASDLTELVHNGWHA